MCLNSLNKLKISNTGFNDAKISCCKHVVAKIIISRLVIGTPLRYTARSRDFLGKNMAAVWNANLTSSLPKEVYYSIVAVLKQSNKHLQTSSRFLIRMLVEFLLLTAPASRKANPHCITEKERWTMNPKPHACLTNSKPGFTSVDVHEHECPLKCLYTGLCLQQIYTYFEFCYAHVLG